MSILELPHTGLLLFIGAALFGLVVGSFLNVCIWRVPRKQSLIMPGSRCPSCSTPIRPHENIPVLSYIFLAGKCRHCGERISPRYPLVEAANAALYVLVLGTYGIGVHLPFYLLFVSALLVITFIDLDFQIIPDGITLTGIPLGLIAGALFLRDPFLRSQMLWLKASFIGAFAGFGFFYAVAMLSRGGMGGGDIKMMGMVGAVLGWKGVFLTTLLGSLAGSVFGSFLILFRGKGRKTKVPFGPFLALGAVVSLLLGEEILRWHMGFYAGD